MLALLLALQASFHTPTDGWETLTIRGTERRFLLHIPGDLAPQTTVPLVLVFHGFGSNAAEMAAYTRFDACADRHHFAVAYGEGIDKRWRTPTSGKAPHLRPDDDIAFVNGMIDRVSSKAKIDPKAIFTTGMSDGAIFTIYLAEALNHRLAAIAPVAGTLYGVGATVHLARPMPAILFNGQADIFLPYKGTKVGGKPFTTGAETTASILAAKNLDVTTPIAWDVPNPMPADGCTIRRYDYSGDGEVVLYSIKGAGHEWPGSPLSKEQQKLLGKPCLGIDATELIWEFFDRHRRP